MENERLKLFLVLVCVSLLVWKTGFFANLALNAAFVMFGLVLIFLILVRLLIRFLL
jgi:uncharacterized protein YpmS